MIVNKCPLGFSSPTSCSEIENAYQQGIKEGKTEYRKNVLISLQNIYYHGNEIVLENYIKQLQDECLEEITNE